MAHEIWGNWGNLNTYWGILSMYYPIISMITPFDNNRGNLRQRLRQSQFALGIPPCFQFARTEIFASARISGHGL
jgi:hypothetical protein